MSAVCWDCVEDEYLKKIIQEKGEVQLCSECDSSKRKAFTADDLAELLSPILQEHYAPARKYRDLGIMTTTGGSRREIPFLTLFRRRLNSTSVLTTR